MDVRLKRKRALVTGSTAGIGLATAKQLAREGTFVYINGRTEERVRKALAELEGDADGIAADSLQIPTEMVQYGVTKTA